MAANNDDGRMRPPETTQVFCTTSGTRVTIRPIRPADRAIEDEFVRNLSPNSRYLRFLATIRELSPRDLDRFTSPDYPRELALIATIDDRGAEREIGVARYAATGPGDTAEFAIVVADDWQGHGIGRELLRLLFDEARNAGYEHIEGIVLKANANMLQLCRELGFTVNPYPEDPSLVRVVRNA